MSQTETQTNPTTVEQDDRPVYDFFFPKTDAKHDRVELAIEMRRFLEEIPKTKATFSLSSKRFTDLSKYHPTTRGRRNALQSIPMWFFGVWRLVPPYKKLNDGRNSKKFVNPNYAHARKFPDCIVQCDCGAYVAHKRKTCGGQLGAASDHDDGCRLEWRYDCRAEVVRKRRDVIKRGLRFGLETNTIMARLGMEGNSWGTTIQRLDVDLESLRQERKELLVFTVDELLERGYSKTEVRDALGITYRRLRLRLKEFDLYYGRHD